MCARRLRDAGAAEPPEKRLKLCVSDCLLGTPCRYDGASKPNAAVRELAAFPEVDVVRVCPERASRLPVPRPPAERQGERVVLETGEDVSEAFAKGASREVARALEAGCTHAVLKAKSPSCGTGRIYDGTFSRTLRDGWGVAAERLRAAGVACTSEETVETKGAAAFLMESLESSSSAG